MVCFHDKLSLVRHPSATTAAIAVRFVLGEHGESGLIFLWFLARNEPANRSEGWGFAHSMLSQRAQFAPCRQSILDAVADGNRFSIGIAMIVVSDHVFNCRIVMYFQLAWYSSKVQRLA